MLNRIITFGIFSNLFFCAYVLFKQPFEFYPPYIFIIAFLPFFILKFKFPAFALKILLPLLIFGLMSVWTKDNTYPFFFKIYLNIFISVLFYYYVFVAYDFDVEKLFGFYMTGAYLVCFIGVIQFISFRLGFEPGYNFRWLGFNKSGFVPGGLFGIRINSIMSEPSTIAGTIAPAFVVSLYNILFRKSLFVTKRKSIVIVLIYLLTFSSVAYIGVFIALILILVNLGFIRYVLIFVPLIFFSYYFLYNSVADFRERVDGIEDLYDGKATKGFDVHGSSFVQYNNLHIAWENLKHNPLYGTGLGSHQVAYDKYTLGRQFGVVDEFNKQDANSMFYRMMSETGLFGIVFIVWFIFSCFVLKNKGDDDNNLWLISSAALAAILLQLLRQGNYTFNGFMFYMWLYYYTKKLAINNEITDEAAETENIIPVH